MKLINHGIRRKKIKPVKEVKKKGGAGCIWHMHIGPADYIFVISQGIKMIINVLYGDEYVDIIEIPNDNLDIYYIHNEFVKWVQHENSEYRVVQNGKVTGFSYGIDVFINWLNENYFNTENKAKILKRNTLEFNKENVSLYF